MKVTSDRVDAVAACERHLSTWETDFIESIDSALQLGKELTPGQEAKFNEIEGRLEEEGRL